MEEHRDGNATRKAPATVVGGTRVTVAFPCSKIALQEPSEDMRDLVFLVADLADAIAGGAEGGEGASLHTRAAELRAQFATQHGARAK